MALASVLAAICPLCAKRLNMVQKLRLIPDRYHLKNVGQLNNGNYYWIDVQLDSNGRETRDFIATYIFDADGVLIEHKIIELGIRSDPSALSARVIIGQESTRIGVKKRKDFWVRPFSVKANGAVFGLVVREREQGELEGFQAVDAMPGWTLMFYPPWADGLYDT